MSSVFRTKALILRHSPEREVDRKLNVLMPQYGLQHIRARGTKKSVSKLSGSLEPLTEVDMMIANGRVVDIVTGSVILQRFSGLRSDLVSLVAAQWLLEFVEQVTRPNESDQELYDMVLGFLHAMEQEGSLPVGQRWLRLCRRAWYLLRHQGYAPSAWRCSVCQREMSIDDVRFHPQRGFMHSAEAQPESIAILADTVSYIRGGQTNSQRTTFRQLHDLIEEVLHHSIDRPLRSEPVLRSIMQLERLSSR